MSSPGEFEYFGCVCCSYLVALFRGEQAPDPLLEVNAVQVTGRHGFVCLVLVASEHIYRLTNRMVHGCVAIYTCITISA